MASGGKLKDAHASLPAPTRVLDHMKSMFGKDDLTDLEIRFRDGRSMRVHKVVVYQCDFFRLACSSSFKEAQDKLITFPEDDPAALVIVLAYLYGFCLLDFELSMRLEEMGLDLSDYCSNLLYTNLLARKYELPGLRCEAVLAFHGHLASTFCSSSELQAANAAAVRRVYDEEELADLKELVVDAVHASKDDFRDDPETFSALLDEVPQLARDLAMFEFSRSSAPKAGSKLASDF